MSLDNQALPPEQYSAYVNGVYATPPVKPIIPAVVTKGEIPYAIASEELEVMCVVAYEHLRYPNGECELAKDPEILEVTAVANYLEQPAEFQFARPGLWVDQLEMTETRKERYLAWARMKLAKSKLEQEELTEAILQHVRG